jgi:phosphonate degradation associated HDIG domain protein
MDVECSQVIEHLMMLFHTRGRAEYGSDRVSQLEHALQTAWQAQQQQDDHALIVAALLHDVGHLLHALAPGYLERHTDDHHETLGARWLGQYFGPAVTMPIQLHVAAKRYLCATEPDYYATLSPISVRSLEVQGGPFTAAQAQRFIAQPFAQQAVVLRRWDEQAKVRALGTPDWAYFRPYLEAALQS